MIILLYNTEFEITGVLIQNSYLGRCMIQWLSMLLMGWMGRSRIVRGRLGLLLGLGRRLVLGIPFRINFSDFFSSENSYK